jgi:phage terminase large subunit GpA-like protein
MNEVRVRALRALVPPPRLQLGDWIEQHLVLPQSTSALPGKVRLWPYQRAIAEAIGDPTIERVTLVKPVRVGFTTLLTGAVGAFVANDPAPILALLPTESDCRDYVVSEVEPIFAATPVLAGLLSDDTPEGERNTLLSRRFPGGSLKIVASRAPRNLRRHSARILLVDEADGMELTTEGNPVTLAERRTLSFPNRKIVIGSTPKFEDTSAVLRSYTESDQRIFECPCPACGAFTEILWQHIEWEPDRPETAAFRCPHCKDLIGEQNKLAMVEAGAWRVTRPEVKGHAGFRLNALVSTLANASWSNLAAEFLAAKGDPAELQVFVNTILAQGFRAPGQEIDETALSSRAEDFGDALPEEVILLTCGADVQADRIEATICGWTKDNTALVLAHGTIWGNPETERLPWEELDELLRTTVTHPCGKELRIAAAVIDSGFATQRVYEFCASRLKYRHFAGKGIPGTSRPPVVISKSLAGDRKVRLALVGVDVIKQQVFSRLERGRSIRFDNDLEPSYFEQLTSERRVVTMVRGQPKARFEKKNRHARSEALDCLVYAFAARALVRFSPEQIEKALREPPRYPVQQSPEANFPSAKPESWWDRRNKDSWRNF